MVPFLVWVRTATVIKVWEDFRGFINTVCSIGQRIPWQVWSVYPEYLWNCRENEKEGARVKMQGRPLIAGCRHFPGNPIEQAALTAAVTVMPTITLSVPVTVTPGWSGGGGSALDLGLAIGSCILV